MEELGFDELVGLCDQCKVETLTKKAGDAKAVCRLLACYLNSEQLEELDDGGMSTFLKMRDEINKMIGEIRDKNDAVKDGKANGGVGVVKQEEKPEERLQNTGDPESLYNLLFQCLSSGHVVSSKGGRSLTKMKA